jgi:uncharacterized membrane-anchored protein
MATRPSRVRLPKQLTQPASRFFPRRDSVVQGDRGRYGYEKITYIVGADAIRTAPQILFLIANAHQFPSGTAYTDYVAGADHAAEYGIAGLVAGVLGVKVLKVAAGSGLALFAKKLGWLLILPVVWVWRKVRSQKEPTVPSIRSIVPKE